MKEMSKTLKNIRFHARSVLIVKSSAPLAMITIKSLTKLITFAKKSKTKLMNHYCLEGEEAQSGLKESDQIIPESEITPLIADCQTISCAIMMYRLGRSCRIISMIELGTTGQVLLSRSLS